MLASSSSLNIDYCSFDLKSTNRSTTINLSSSRSIITHLHLSCCNSIIDYHSRLIQSIGECHFRRNSIQCRFRHNTFVTLTAIADHIADHIATHYCIVIDHRRWRTKQPIATAAVVVELQQVTLL